MIDEKKVFHTSILHHIPVSRSAIPDWFDEEAAKKARKFHQGLPNYAETPLAELKALASQIGVRSIFIKNESGRFGLNAFKGLGGSYAMFRILCERFQLDPEKTSYADLMQDRWKDEIRKVAFVTATDGNHGRGVSWAAGLFGCRAYIYMPAGTVKVRAEAIRKAGPAEVIITDMNYDDTVQFAASKSRENDWYLIQDTAWDGYEKIPTWIIQGYLTMALEAREQLAAVHAMPTHIILQAGVGAMAGGVTAYFANCMQDHLPEFIVVEPEEANCIYRSAAAGDGNIHSCDGMPKTIMAGLNCGTPCKITWPVLRDYPEFYMACPDYLAACGMRLYAQPYGDDPQIIAGESGAVSLGALYFLMTREEFAEIREEMGLNNDSVILLFNTEGNTDPEDYDAITKNGRYPIPEVGFCQGG